MSEQQERYDIESGDYLACFSSAQGRRVLAHLLVEGHFFEECMSWEETIERNLTVRILRNMGAFEPQNIITITNSLITAAAAASGTKKE